MKLFALIPSILILLLIQACCTRTVFGQQGELPLTCASPVYCHGELLHTIQTNKVFSDSKTFVDMKMMNSVNETLSNFRQMMESADDEPTMSDLRTFIGHNFELGNELEDWTPPDYNPNPKFLDKIVDPAWKHLAGELVKIWPTLARRVKPEVLLNPERYSLIPVENGFVVPGGRFREFYYWDTYWIVKGLLLCEMQDTVRGMLDNFLSMVDRYGFVPNGGRVYYTERTQPPLLSPMALKYYIKSKDDEWLRNNIDMLDKELSFFVNNRTLMVNKDNVDYLMARYKAPSAGPRPESYHEDYKTAQIAQDEDAKNQIYMNLKSGAESGWDFSSRWFFDENGSSKSNLSFINTTRIVPVDLNAFMCGAAKDLSSMYIYLGKARRAEYWQGIADKLAESIEKVLWNEELGSWFDWDTELSKHKVGFYVSNVSPLWTKCLQSQDDLPNKGKRVFAYLEETGALNFTGGTPTSLEHSGEQWDYPNAWPPLQAIMIQSLENTGLDEAITAAKQLADLWIHANYLGYNRTNEMFEKYDAENPGEYGGGGEYVVQAGFGWTNGVALELIDHYSTEN